jgi:hypothetical protein
MRGRRVIAGLVAVALAFLLTVALRPRGPQPCRMTFEQVREGMTFDEVCATVGGPPGDYSRGESWWGGHGVKFCGCEGWLGPDAQLMVRFDPDGRADRVSVVGCERCVSKPSFLDRLRARLGL